MWGAGGLVHPRTRVGGGARWLAVVDEFHQHLRVGEEILERPVATKVDEWF